MPTYFVQRSDGPQSFDAADDAAAIVVASAPLPPAIDYELDRVEPDGARRRISQGTVRSIGVVP